MGYGLLPTPKIPPLREAIWLRHPVIELENILNISRRERKFTLLEESEKCVYIPGIYLRYLTGIYGKKIARLSIDSEEAQKLLLQNEFTPRTKEIYQMLEDQLLRALQDACIERNNKGSGFASYTKG